MSKTSTSPQDKSHIRDTRSDRAAQSEIKSDDHGAFRVHVQLLGPEWPQTA
ncbi:hypothetical protein [Swaminathania salitolerans]|uniref:Uncharacterized protein n=1 Tax=Swaminathania salitolerans TaxID=182838 RepID=A0A511BSD4_9PROT|nr:hypothetical protein [Swaminathania salitolerans]GBQ11523.1 hypothetical protein AA21291_0854 [Swaminathania salitolerans LMG 21291]GEL02514.1 hypothetical protein SSA02_16770 [Swaminathania salitolerans]